MFGGLTADIFAVFLDNLEEVIGDFDVTVIMDNAPPHRNADMSGSRHSIVRLPPYSPFLNPIEMAFSTLKATVKRHLNERMAEIFDHGAAVAANLPMTEYRQRILKNIVRSAIEDGTTITQEKCSNWHRHVFRYLPACINREDIQM